MNLDDIDKAKKLKELLEDIEDNPFLGFDCSIEKKFSHGCNVSKYRKKMVKLNTNIRLSMRSLIKGQTDMVKQEIVNELRDLGVEVAPGVK